MKEFEPFHDSQPGFTLEISFSMKCHKATKAGLTFDHMSQLNINLRLQPCSDRISSLATCLPNAPTGV